jgi:HAD superfamily hydrolase (TIGR01490 family)
MAKTNRPFAVFDIDGTLIRWQLYHAMADTMVKQGLIDPLKYKTVLTARNNWKNRSSEDSFSQYETSMVRLVTASFAGINHDQFTLACKSVTDRYKGQVYTYTRDLIASLRQQNYLIFAISGSPVELVKEIADYYSFDDYGASHFPIIDNHLSTPVHVAVGKNKVLILKEMINKHQASKEGSIGVGDTAGDIPLLKQVETAIAFNPTKELFNRAVIEQWQVVIERKNMFYQLQYEDGRYVLAATEQRPTLI